MLPHPSIDEARESIAAVALHSEQTVRLGALVHHERTVRLGTLVHYERTVRLGALVHYEQTVTGRGP